MPVVGGRPALIGAGRYATDAEVATTYARARPFDMTHSGATRLHATSAYLCKGVDATDNRVYAADYTGQLLRQSDDYGTTWSTTKTLPTGVAYNGWAQIVRFGAHIYMLANDGGDGDAAKVYRATPTAGNTVLSWSAAVHELSAGASAFPGCITADASYLYVVEYGDPTGGPQIWRSPDGTTWTSVYAADATLRHFHCIAADPFNIGHLWVTSGDGAAKPWMKSDDYGTTWEVVSDQGTYQSVQISFTQDYVWGAGDSQKATAWVIHRTTEEVASASSSWHYNLLPPDDPTERYYANAFYGAADPDTGIYYCAANDTSVAGDRNGLFFLPQIGQPFQLLDEGGFGVIMNGQVLMLGAYLFTGMWRHPLVELGGND